MHLFRRTVGILLMAGAGACRIDPSPQERTRKTDDAIVNGTASDAGDDEVVLILTHVPKRDTSQGTYYRNCTGTLLAPNVVVTARHCVSETSDGTFACNEDGTLATGPGGTVLYDYVPSDTHVYVGPMLPSTVDPSMFPGQGAAYVHDGATTLCNHDLALIVLAAPIPNAKIAPIRLDGGVTVGETFTAIGWGATVTDFIPPGRQRRDGVQVLLTGPSSVAYYGSLLADREFRASESVCQGDSGGPALDTKTGAVIGTVSNGPNGGVTMNGSGCVGTTHTFQETSPYKDLVLQAVGMAGGSPWLEGQPMPSTSGAGGATASSSSTGSGMKAKAKTSSGGCSVGRTGSATAPASAWAAMLALLALGARFKRRASGRRLKSAR
jgi:hypothetical protein